MSLILNINSATDTAFVALAKDKEIIGLKENANQKDHAGFLHPAIENIMANCGLQFNDLDAIAVTAGPGSYTGIRVGMATAKGLCFALRKPLITINTLELLAHDVIENYTADENWLCCPMIDARRMEVYTALYDHALKEIVSPLALIIEEDFYRKFSTNFKLVLFGNGSTKCRNLSIFEEALFIENVNIPQSMSLMTEKLVARKAFTDLILSEPTYLKQFFNKS